MKSKFIRGMAVAATLLVPAGGLAVYAGSSAGAVSAHVGTLGTVKCTTAGPTNYTNCRANQTLRAHVKFHTNHTTHGTNTASIAIITVTCTVYLWNLPTLVVGTSYTLHVTNGGGTTVHWSDTGTGCSGLTTPFTIALTR